MKLSLRQEENVSILDIDGNIDSHNFTVLKAGLSKLMQNGKNRIVVHIQSNEDLANDVIRELAILDVFARELSGKIVLVSGNTDLKQKVQTFAKPPVVAILTTVPLAVAYLKDLGAGEGDEEGGTPAQLQAALDEKTKQVEALEARLKLVDPGAVQSLRKENAMLTDKVKLLETQIGELLGGGRKQPADAEGFVEKFEALEENIRKLSGEKLAGAAK